MLTPVVPLWWVGVAGGPKPHKQPPGLEVLIDLPSWQELEIITKLT